MEILDRVEFDEEGIGLQPLSEGIERRLRCNVIGQTPLIAVKPNILAMAVRVNLAIISIFFN